MPISIVVGGQYGSEGKGKIAHWLAKKQGVKYAIRVGGSNSGHTVKTDEGTKIFRQLPTPILEDDVTAVIPSGSYIDLDVLFDEIQLLNLQKKRLLIHPFAVVVEDWMRDKELQSGLVENIASTGQGIGIAVAKRVMRDASVKFAKDIPQLTPFVSNNLMKILGASLKKHERILIEGTQGYGLSLLHGGHYPYATSRDTSAAGALSESGLSPLDVDHVALVIRAFPIRVAGNSGPLANEICWDQLTKEANSSLPLLEKTTVTNKTRRVGRFDSTIVKQAIEANAPTLLCLNHIDYFDFSVHESTAISDIVLKSVAEIESSIGRQIDFLGTGPETVIGKTDVICRKLDVA